MHLRTLIMAMAAALAVSGAAHAAGDAAKGKILFNQQCSLCHSAAPGQEGAGPSLYGVVGRKAAGDPAFPAYTKALKASGQTWTATNLETFLSGPARLAPGTAMPITLPNPEDRRNVVAYLETLKR
jgi:cytochrome c